MTAASLADVPRETVAALELYVQMLLDENRRQNLISKASEAEIWERHIVDGLQLARFVRPNDRTMVDIGSGPGLPGMVLALATSLKITLVEPRPLRTAFLERVVERLDLRERVTVVQGKAESLRGTYDLITGRAVASVDRFLALSHHLSTENTRWVLPKGRRAANELDDARRVWHIECEVVPSTTGGDGQILVIDKAERKGRG